MSEEKKGDFKSLIKAAEGRGWRIIRSHKHIILIWTNGKKATIPSTASDHRAWFNARATLRRIEREQA